MSNKLVRLHLNDGTFLQTFETVLLYEPDSLFAQLLGHVSLKDKLVVLLECRHRDGRMLRLMVDALRQLAYHGDPSALLWPDDFDEWKRLIAEAHYWRLKEMEEHFTAAATQHTNTISISYHGALSTGKSVGGAGGGNSEVNFRRIHRLLVHGQVLTCREVFGEHLNENRDGNVDYNRYTSRFYLTHGFLEQAFDTLAAHRFRLIASTSHTPTGSTTPISSIPLHKQVMAQSSSGGLLSNSDRQFLHYAQFVFLRTS